MSDAYIALLFWILVGAFLGSIALYIVAIVNAHRGRWLLADAIMGGLASLLMYWSLSRLISMKVGIIYVGFLGVACYALALYDVKKLRWPVFNIIIAILGCLFLYIPVVTWLGSGAAWTAIAILGLMSSLLIFLSVRIIMVNKKRGR